MEIEEFAAEQRANLKEGEAAVTIHTLEGNSYWITIVDEHSTQLMAVTPMEMKKLYKLLKKKYG